MIYPNEVIVNKFNPDYDEYEARIDAVLKRDWYEGEERKLDVLPGCHGRCSVHPVVTEMLARYSRAGWKCDSWGYTSMSFTAPRRSDPKKDSSPGKRRWWVW